LNKIFFDEPDKRSIIINQLKEFTINGDIHLLATNIRPIFNTMSQHQKDIFLKEIVKFIPQNKQDQFKELIQLPLIRNENVYLNDDNNIKTLLPKGRRHIFIDRKLNEPFGISLRGDRPVYVESVAKNSPAERSGIHVNDIILAINDVEVEDKTKEYVVNVFRNPNATTFIDVIQTNDYLNYIKTRQQSNRVFIRPKFNDQEMPTSMSSDDINRKTPPPPPPTATTTFKQKVKEVLNLNEKSILKSILLKYNNTK
jgi:predicted metalloprotease with PDZ domain